MDTKKCRICLRFLSLDNFAKSLTNKDKLDTRCKECIKNYSKNLRARYREKNKLLGGEVQKGAKYCSVCERTLPKTEFHKSLLQADGLESYCKSCHEVYKRRYRAKHPHYQWAYHTITTHVHRGCTVNFTTKELVVVAKQAVRCFYCGELLDWSIKGKLNPNSPTLDRGNNETKLTLDNTKIVCLSCNSGKLNQTYEQFVARCMNVVKLYKANNQNP